jgi:hypothetical protein
MLFCRNLSTYKIGPIHWQTLHKRPKEDFYAKFVSESARVYKLINSYKIAFNPYNSNLIDQPKCLIFNPFNSIESLNKWNTQVRSNIDIETHVKA